MPRRCVNSPGRDTDGGKPPMQNESIPCACGCGTPIARVDAYGREHRFVKGHSAYKGRSFEERFWSFVDKSGECWLWTGHKSPSGYGTIAKRNPGSRSTPVRANRASWEIHFGPIPPGMFVCHRCDVPACVRPDHLFLDDNRGNILDASRKGRIATGLRNGAYTRPERMPRGEEHWARRRPELVRKGHVTFAKVTPDQVRAIRASYSAGDVRLADLASRFGITKGSVANIVKRRTWQAV